MKEIKAIRQHLDHLMIQTKQYPSNREVSLAYTNTQRASMWLGQVLKELAEPNPYPNSTDTSNTKIEPRADQMSDSPALFEGAPTGNNTITVKWFRSQLDGIISQLGDLFEEVANDKAMNALIVASDAAKEAKMWWGWELNNIFNAEKASAK